MLRFLVALLAFLFLFASIQAAPTAALDGTIAPRDDIASLPMPLAKLAHLSKRSPEWSQRPTSQGVRRGGCNTATGRSVRPFGNRNMGKRGEAEAGAEGEEDGEAEGQAMVKRYDCYLEMQRRATE